MTSDQRAGIDNGIWLCANHGRLVDTDAIMYTVEVLKLYKANHEVRCKQALAGGAGGRDVKHLVALGPEIVAVGDLSSALVH